MDEDDLEFEGDSDDDLRGVEFQPPRRPEDSRHYAAVQDWSRQNPEAEARFIREDPDENCAVLELWGTELQIYIPQDDDSDFFVTTDDEDGRVNSILTELNDMAHVRKLPDLLSEASRRLGSRLAGAVGALALQRTQTTSSAGGMADLNFTVSADDLKLASGQPQLSRGKSSVVLNCDGLRELQDELINKVSLAANVEKHVGAMLLLQCKWDDEQLLQCLAADSAALFQAAGAALGVDEVPLPAPQLCSVCFVDEAIECLPCGHGLCGDDWPAFLKCNLESGTVDGENCLRLKCPGERCKLRVPGSHFRKFLEPDDYMRYERLRVLSFVNDNQKIVWCPAKGCELCVGFSQRKSTVKCNCGHRFCFSCKAEAHAPAKCSSAKAWLEKREKMKGVEGLQRMTDSKPCPNPDCGVLSHKESGCHYLHCPHCKEHWCWQCGDWGGGPSKRPEPHHVFDCNNPVNQNWAKSAVSLDDEGRFWYYYDRHENHIGSLKFAQELHAALPEASWGGTEKNPPEISRDYSSVLYYDQPGQGFAQSMLDSPGAWTAARDCVGEWMQIDLGAVYSVVGIVVQGRCKGEGLVQEAWVTRLRVEYGSNSIRPDGVVGEFQGNTDAGSRVEVSFNTPMSSRFIRLSPLTWEGHIAMRAGVMVFDEVRGGEWECTQCTLVNSRDQHICKACGELCPTASGDFDAPSVKRKQEARELMLNASELLVECRLVLAWTYVWAFFEKHEVKRELFEFVQKDLETKTELLSGMIENQPLEKVLRERLRLLDYVSALRGYMENIKEYTIIDPEAEVPAV